MPPTVRKMTPVLYVDRIERCLPFWVERLGFEATLTVPEEDAAGFVILVRGGIEVMLQSRASLRKDVPALARAPSSVTLYCEVDDLDAWIPRLHGLDVVIPRRTTAYGADEIGVHDPAGNVVMLARHGA